MGRTPSARPRCPACPTSTTGSTGPWPRTDLGADRIPVWAGLVRVLQWVLILSALAGAVWLALLAFGSYARLPEPPTPEVWGFPVPTLLLLGGVALGVLLALVCRLLVVADREVAGPHGRQAAARRDLGGLRRAGRRADRGRAGVLRRGPRRARRRAALTASRRRSAVHRRRPAAASSTGRLVAADRRLSVAVAEPWVIAAEPPPPDRGGTR